MNRLDKPRFSIVIPCYNEANYLATTLDSIKSQTFDGKVEIIIVDNNCTDETVQIAKKYNARVIVEKNPGVCWARQAGTKAAKGEIVVSTDADTIFSKNWLVNINNTFGQNSKIVAVGGPCRYITGPWWGRVYTHFLFGSVYMMQYIIRHPYYLSATNIAFKRSAWQGYNVNLPQAGDEVDFLHRLRKQGKVKFIYKNPTYTSGRRLEQGLIYNLFVTFFYYYLAAYYLNRMFNRIIIGPAPAFRKKPIIKAVFSSGLVSLYGVLLLVVVAIPYSRTFLKDNVHDTVNTIDKVKSEIRNI
ncbi:MAG TPA: glycosyltransferase family A protein [Candidatus Dormibacteraeota bacterium]|nr:glycosyltransferase family A protein [Candidatus Dormibacteraeota bacterium]